MLKGLISKQSLATRILPHPGSDIPGTITAFSPLHKHNMHACSILVWIMKPKENNPTDTSFLSHSLWILLIYWHHRSYLFSLMPALFQSIGGCFIYKSMKSTNLILCINLIVNWVMCNVLIVELCIKFIKNLWKSVYFIFFEIVLVHLTFYSEKICYNFSEPYTAFI